MKGKMLGMVLIAFGILVLLSNMGLFVGEYFLLMVGSVFLVAYYKSTKAEKPIGFLIPGLVTMAVGIFANIERFVGPFDGSVFFVILGMAFILIHSIHSQQTDQPQTTKWAMWVGFGMLCFAAFILLVDFVNLAPFTFIFKNFWPVALILIGGSMIFRQKKSS